MTDYENPEKVTDVFMELFGSFRVNDKGLILRRKSNGSDEPLKMQDKSELYAFTFKETPRGSKIINLLREGAIDKNPPENSLITHGHKITIVNTVVKMMNLIMLSALISNDKKKEKEAENIHKDIVKLSTRFVSKVNKKTHEAFVKFIKGKNEKKIDSILRFYYDSKNRKYRAISLFSDPKKLTSLKFTKAQAEILSEVFLTIMPQMRKGQYESEAEGIDCPIFESFFKMMLKIAEDINPSIEILQEVDEAYRGEVVDIEEVKKYTEKENIEEASKKAVFRGSTKAAREQLLKEKKEKRQERNSILNNGNRNDERTKSIVYRTRSEKKLDEDETDLMTHFRTKSFNHSRDDRNRERPSDYGFGQSLSNPMTKLRHEEELSEVVKEDRYSRSFGRGRSRNPFNDDGGYNFGRRHSNDNDFGF